jgi:hypothetical protein
MAHPLPYTDIGSSQGGRSFLTLRWTSAVSGGVGAVDANKKFGFDATTPTAHGATGVYTVKTEEQFADFIKADVQIKQASYSKTGACFGKVTAYNLASKTITLLVVDAAGDATDPTTSDVITVDLQMQTYLNSTQ